MGAQSVSQVYVGWTGCEWRVQSAVGCG